MLAIVDIMAARNSVFLLLVLCPLSISALIASAPLKAHHLAHAALYPPLAVVCKVAPPPPTFMASAKAAVAGVISYFGTKRTVLAMVIAVALLVTSELSKRAKLIQSSENCMLGDESACAEYDERVEVTSAWKLRSALNKLSLTNVLQERLDGAPPKGFTWGPTF